MSRCDIRIDFDRDDRNYQGGETVSGVVHITVNKDTRCNGIVLSHYWKTHGRGNTSSGAKSEILLSEMVPLQAGEELQLPFEFTAEVWPLTYHGHYINVDHYVRVGVDVPWALDPKLEEDYILLPGRRPPEFSGERGEKFELEKTATEATGILKFFLFGLLAVFGLLFATLFVVLIPIFVIVGGGVWIWKKMIASRVGEVALSTPHVLVAPGEQWPLDLSFTAKKTFPINGITARIWAQEAATSGSGTNKTTHHHTLHDETHTLHPEGTLLMGDEFSESFAVTLPETSAWNLKESDNRITWKAEVRIDIPRFPDWKREVELQFVPQQFLDDVLIQDDYKNPEGEPPPSDGIGSGFSLDPPTSADQSENVYADNSVVPLLALVDEISRAGRFGNERSEIVGAAEGHEYDILIELDRVSPTFGFPHDDDRYETGKTVIGRIAETDQELQLFTVNASNASLEDTARGETWRTLATVTSWDSLYNRLVMLEVPGSADRHRTRSDA